MHPALAVRQHGSDHEDRVLRRDQRGPHDRAFDRPMQFFGKLGIGFLGLSGLIFAWAIALKYGYDVSLIQTPLPLLAATVGLSGILFVLLGIMAEVQARIYFEARGKPPYKIKSVVEHSAVMRRLNVVSARW